MNAWMRLFLLSASLLCCLGTCYAQQAPQKFPVREHQHVDLLPKQAIARVGTTRLRHSADLLSVVHSVDGRFIATVGKDFRVCVWDGRQWHLVCEIAEARTNIHSVALSPDGNYLAIGTANTTKSRDRHVRVYSLPSGKLVWKHQADSWVITTHLAFSADNSALAAYGFGQLCRWDTKTGRKLGSLRWEQDGGTVAISADHRLIAHDNSPSSTTIILRDANSGKKVGRLGSHDNVIYTFAFSPDGKRLFSSSSIGPVLVWDVTKQTICRKISSVGASSFGFSADSQLVSILDVGGRVSIWNLATKKQLSKWAQRELSAPLGISAAALCSEGKQLAVIKTGSQVLWMYDVPTGNRLSPPRSHNGPIRSVAFSPLSTTVAVSSTTFESAFQPQHELALWNAQNGKLERPLENPPMTYSRVFVDVIPNTFIGSTSTGSTPILFDWKNNKKLESPWQSKPRPDHSSTVPLPVAVSPGGLVAFACHDDTLQIWNLKDRRLVVKCPSFLPTIGSLDFSPDGQELAVCGENGVVLWNWQSGGCSPIYQTPKADLVRYSGDGQRVAILVRGDSSRIALWNRQTRQLRERFLDLPIVGDLAFAPDGKTLAVATAAKADTLTPELRIYEVASGQIRSSFRGHTGLISCLAFSRDGTRLASGSEDTTTLIWNVSPSSGANQKRKPLTAIRFEKLWSLLKSENAGKAYGAMRVLVSHGRQAEGLITQKLTEAVTITPTEIDRTIRLLDHKRYAYRERAMIRLVHLGRNAIPQLQEALAKETSRELRERIDTLLVRIREKPLEGDQLRTTRVNEVLDWIRRLSKP